jgi:hypothetical protein
MPASASIPNVSISLRPATILVVLLPVLAGCTVTSVVEEPDPAAIPSGEPVAIGAEATGPVTSLGSGRVTDIGWRYVIYESAEGWCTELQMVEVTSTSCGPDLLPPEGEHIGSVGAGQPLGNGVTPVAGIVSEEIHTVSVMDEGDVRRLPGVLMPLDAAGLDGQAFLAFMPADMTPTHVQVLVLSGEIVQTYELP